MRDIFKKQKIQMIFPMLVMLIFLMFMIVPIYSMTDASKIICERVELDDGWTITINHSEFQNVTLSDFVFEMCHKGDQLCYKRKLPKNANIDFPILELYTVHSVIDVYLDQEPIYSYGHSLYEANQLVGYGKNFIPLPADYAGKELQINLTVTENNAFEGQQALSISEGNTLYIKELAERRVMLMICLFLILFGIIVMILSTIMLQKNKSFIQTFCIAMFSFLVGCWTLCSSDLIEYFNNDLLVKLYIEYTSFYALPVPFTYYFKNRIEDRETPTWLKRYFWILVGSEIAFFGFVYVCQLFNWIHYPRFVWMVHIIMGIALLFIVLLNIVEIRSKKNKYSAIAIGFGFAVVAVTWELIQFNLSKYITGFQNNQYNSSLGIVILIVVISLLIDFSQEITRMVYKSTRQRLLEQMAYMDELTGLANRRRCEDILEELHQKAADYAVISLDMNYLKQVNDAFGHEKGDKLIQLFAEMLTDVYSAYGTVGRMGGDEFIVILPDVSRIEAERLITQMEMSIYRRNQSELQLKLSTAYGLAMSDEVLHEQDVRSAYKLADERMYENKRQSKIKRV